ncbi:MAG: phosphoribosylformylglycinamidine cyclo-ligase [Methanomassiliicoccales archaeon]
MSEERMTYAKAGVDIEAKSKAISSLIKQLRHRRGGRGTMMEVKGQFTSLIDFGDVALTLCTDGVGTKLLVAQAMRKWDTVGIDCIAMNVNDTICVGAEPLAFVDYIAMDRPDPVITEAIGMGLEKGARLSNCEIVGGEIAVLPEIVQGVDLSGSCLGFVPKDKIVTGAEVKVGDVIIGLPSSGVHSNGLTLARKVLERSQVPLHERPPELKRTVGEELLQPTAIYVRKVLRMLEVVHPTGMVDITGGGLRNFVRLKKGVRFTISRPLRPQPIFQLLQELGDIEDKEMYQTFNMGMGFAVVLRENDSKEALQLLGKGAKIVGSVEEGQGVVCSPLDLEYHSY